VLFYRLVIATHGSHLIALCTVLTFFSLRRSQTLAGDVMLEFPTLVFIVVACYCLRDFEQGYRFRRSLMFATLAAAAVWTKQHAWFLGLVPFLLIVINRQWPLLAQKTVWLSSLLLGLLVLPLVFLSMLFGWTGLNQVTTGQSVSPIFFHNLGFYLRGLR